MIPLVQGNAEQGPAGLYDLLMLQENTQVLPSAIVSSLVGSKTSRLSSGPGTGLLVIMKSLGPAFGFGLGSTVYIS